MAFETLKVLCTICVPQEFHDKLKPDNNPLLNPHLCYLVDPCTTYLCTILMEHPSLIIKSSHCHFVKLWVKRTNRHNQGFSTGSKVLGQWAEGKKKKVKMPLKELRNNPNFKGSFHTEKQNYILLKPQQSYQVSYTG